MMNRSPKKENGKNGSKEIIKNDDDEDDKNNIKKFPETDVHKMKKCSLE